MPGRVLRAWRPAGEPAGGAAGEGNVTADGQASEPGRKALLTLAIAVACTAGRMLAGRHARPAVVGTKTSMTDVVTEMDQAAERLIRSQILAERPYDAILGEEGGQTGGEAPVRWIVDPLDGTVNYLYGLPDWAVSIAAEFDGEVVAGAVCVPMHGNMFTARLGGGAWLESDWLTDGARRLTCSAEVPLAEAPVATGF